jgi:hypothetical protein
MTVFAIDLLGGQLAACHVSAGANYRRQDIGPPARPPHRLQFVSAARHSREGFHRPGHKYMPMSAPALLRRPSRARIGCCWQPRLFAV